LVRLEDKYGREGSPYEDSRYETPKQDDCLWITDETSTYTFSNCDIKVEIVNNVNIFQNKDDNENIVFLNGGIRTEDGSPVAQAGDVVVCAVIKRLTKLFPYLDDETLIMTIKRDE